MPRGVPPRLVGILVVIFFKNYLRTPHSLCAFPLYPLFVVPTIWSELLISAQALSLRSVFLLSLRSGGIITYIIPKRIHRLTAAARVNPAHHFPGTTSSRSIGAARKWKKTSSKQTTGSGLAHEHRSAPVKQAKVSYSSFFSAADGIHSRSYLRTRICA